MAKKAMKFESSKGDKKSDKGMKENSKKDMAMDRKMMGGKGKKGGKGC